MSEFDGILEQIKKRDVEMGIELVKAQSEAMELRNDLMDCINELCSNCPGNRNRHLGACDRCRWNKMMEGLG